MAEDDESGSDEHVLKAAVELLALDGEEFSSALLLSCSLSRNWVDSWYDQNLGGRMNSIALILAGPPGVYRVLSGLEGLQGNIYPATRGDAEWESSEAARSHPAGIANRHITGIDCLLWGNDYPHPEGTWPKSQEAIAKEFAGVPDDERRAIIFENSAKLYGFSKLIKEEQEMAAAGR